MRILLICFYFPPAGGGGVQRPLKIASHLPALGIETDVLAPRDPKWMYTDSDLADPPRAHVHRIPYWGPRGRMPADELFSRSGLDRRLMQLRLAPRRLPFPDENATYALTAIPAALRLVRAIRPDVVMTTSPPSSIHLIGAATKLLTGTPWVADIRDSLVANHDRQVERPLVRLRERSHRRVARLVARRADGVVAVTPTIAEEQRALGARGPIAVIPNGADFDDFAGLRYSPASRFRITHTGSFFAGRSPRAFLQALQESRLDVAARFVGGFRQVDLAWTEERGLGSRIELVPGATHAETLALQRDSEALLLLLPDAGPRGLDVPSGKLFEYLAAERPILAAVPPDGTAARLVREAGAGIVVSPDDVPGMARALATLHERWQADPTALRPLPADFRARIDRVERVRELAAFLTKVT